MSATNSNPSPNPTQPQSQPTITPIEPAAQSPAALQAIPPMPQKRQSLCTIARTLDGGSSHPYYAKLEAVMKTSIQRLPEDSRREALAAIGNRRARRRIERRLMIA